MNGPHCYHNPSRSGSDSQSQPSLASEFGLPNSTVVRSLVTRRELLRGLAAGTLFLSAGCATPWFSREEKTPRDERAEEIKDVLSSEDRPHLVGEVAISRGLVLVKAQNVALVNGLLGTGGDPKPSEQREALNQEILRQSPGDAEQLISSPNTAMVIATCLIPPGAQKGDRIDVVIKASANAQATSLRNGWLMPTELKEFRSLGGELKPSEQLAMGRGSVITEAELSGKTEPEKLLQGIIPGGAVVKKPGMLSLMVKEEFTHISISAALTKAINNRFSILDGPKPRGVAVPRNNDVIEIQLEPRYRRDPFHYMNVIMSIGFSERNEERAERLELCRKLIQEPTTANRAALQLEAFGKPGIEPLFEGMLTGDDEIRFYAAHALAYLDDPRCIDVLRDLIIKHPAFRAMALDGLVVLDHLEAHETLVELLQEPDPEIRYGAFCSLRDRDLHDPIVRGQNLHNVLQFIEVATNVNPTIVISTSEYPAIIIFGENRPIYFPEFIRVNQNLLLTPGAQGGIRISRHLPGTEGNVQIVSADVRGLVEGITAAGGTFGEVVSTMIIASQKNLLPMPIVMNPKPVAGRKFNRHGADITSASSKLGHSDSDSLDGSTEEEVINDSSDEDSESGPTKPEYGWWDIRRYWPGSSDTTKR